MLSDSVQRQFVAHCVLGPRSSKPTLKRETVQLAGGGGGEGGVAAPVSTLKRDRHVQLEALELLPASPRAEATRLQASLLGIGLECQVEIPKPWGPKLIS